MIVGFTHYDGWKYEIDITAGTLHSQDDGGWVDNLYHFTRAETRGDMAIFYDDAGTVVYEMCIEEIDPESIYMEGEL